MQPPPVPTDSRFPSCVATHPLSDVETLTLRVHELLRENMTEGYSPLLDAYYCYVQPSRLKYPFQWFWDSCFHVFMLCSLDEYALARRNLWSLFTMQEPNGFVGHMIFWKRVFPTTPSDVLQSRPTFSQLRPHMSALIQPSFVAQALKRISDESGNPEYVLSMLSKVKHYLTWVMENRDFDGDHLISIISPVESGMDYKPSYDEALGFSDGIPNGSLFVRAVRADLRNFIRRYHLPAIKKMNGFRVKDVTVNTAFALDLSACAYLCEKFDDPDEQKFRDAATQISEAIVQHMYDADDCAFYDLSGPHNRKLKVKTPSIFFPMILPEVSKQICDAIVDRHIRNSNSFATPFPFPSSAIDEPSFFPEQTWYLWRGPTWIFNNWFLHRTFLARGYMQEADAIIKASHALIDIGGLREYYNPLTGEGEGEDHFTWGGLVLDMMKRADSRKN